MDIASAMLRERAEADFSAEDVADRAGCSRATLYRYVGGRRAILQGVYERALDDLIARTAAAATGLEPRAGLVASFMTAMMGMRADPVISRAAHGDSRVIRQDSITSHKILDAVIADGQLRADDYVAAEMVMRLAWSLVDYPGVDGLSEVAVIARLAELLHPTTPCPNTR